MKSYLLVLSALALAIAATNATTPGASAPLQRVYTAPVPEPLPPAVVVNPAQPVPPPQPQIVLPQPQPEEVEEAVALVEQPDEEPHFTVQSGFDGFIIPSHVAGLIPKTESSVLPLIASLFGLIKLPKFLLGFGPLFGNLLFALGAIGAVGAVACTFTPFCAITLFGFRSEEVKNTLKSQRVKTAVEFITNSIDKYRTLVKQIEDAAAENVERKKAAKGTNVSKNRRR